MPNYAIVLLAVAVGAVVIWVFMRSRSGSGIDEVVARRAGEAKLSSRADLVDGRNHIPVALTLQPGHLLYENSDLQADLELERIDEVEYASDLLTGSETKGRVLRVRAHGRAFEFVLDDASAKKWSQALPEHRMGDRDQPRA